MFNFIKRVRAGVFYGVIIAVSIILSIIIAITYSLPGSGWNEVPSWYEALRVAALVFTALLWMLSTYKGLTYKKD